MPKYCDGLRYLLIFCHTVSVRGNSETLCTPKGKGAAIMNDTEIFKDEKDTIQGKNENEKSLIDEDAKKVIRTFKKDINRRLCNILVQWAQSIHKTQPFSKTILSRYRISTNPPRKLCHHFM